MSSAKKRRIPSSFASDAENRACELYGVKLQEALERIDIRRLNSIEPEFWDDVERRVRSYHENRERRQQEIEEHYRNVLSENDRICAEKIARDLATDRNHALQEISAAISRSKTRKSEKFWRYIKRLCYQIWEAEEQ